MRGELLTSGRTQQVATVLAYRLVQALGLESALIFLGKDPAQVALVAKAGERAEEVRDVAHPRLEPYIEDSLDQELVELRWESDILLLASIKVADRRLGYALLGPKAGGEVFVGDEKRLVATMLPMLALAIDKSELSEELREIKQRLVNAEEAERARIARDLHDGPLQLAMMLAGAAGASADDPTGLARQLATELREVCWRLRPAILDDLGIIPALEWHLDEVSKRSDVATRLSLHNIGEEERFPPDVELALFRVTQEAVNNAVKHAKGSSVDVLLSKRDSRLVLNVTDDGAGFSAAPGGTRGLGLPGMRERVIQLDGSFDLQSVPGSGTTVIARIPVTTMQPQAAGE